MAGVGALEKQLAQATPRLVLCICVPRNAKLSSPATMGVVYIAVLSSRKRFAELEPLRQELNASSFPDFEPLHDAVKEDGRYTFKADERGGFTWERPYMPEWEDSQAKRWELDGEVVLKGPVQLSIGHAACEAYIYMPQVLFVHAPGVRREMRRIFFDLAKRFGSAYAIYIPDNLFSPSRAFGLSSRGKSLDEIHNWLCEHVGEPGLNPKAEVEDPDLWPETEEGNWWFIDDFSDLRAV